MLLKLWSVYGWIKGQHLFKQAIKINYFYKTVDTAVSEYYRNLFVNVIYFNKSWMLALIGKYTLNYFSQAVFP